MNEGLIYTDSGPLPFIGYLAERVNEFPELQGVIEQTGQDPSNAIRVYDRYVELVSRFESLSMNEREQIDSASKVLVRTGSASGSASKVSAAGLLSELGDRSNMLTDTALRGLDPDSTHYESAIQELSSRLSGGHKMLLQGKTPSDSDPESLTVIWGHTQITDSGALLHFTICHYLERYYASTLGAEGFEIASQKDFFLNSLIDVLIVDYLGRGEFKDLFDIWAAPKDAGGVGWILPERLASYAQS